MSAAFDAIVIGAGQAGPSLAGRLTQAGMKVALVERKFFGGTCVNTGCMPTKTLVASAYAAHLARRAAEYGVTLDGPVRMDMAAVKARKDRVVMNSRTGVEKWLRGMANCTVLQGQARFQSARTISVGDETLTAERIFINVGGRAVLPAMPGVDQVPTLNNASIMELSILPRHLVVVGGSYIGLEFAQIYRRFGSEVTIVEKGPRLAQREDEDVSDAIRSIMENEGIAIRTNAGCIGFAPNGTEVTVNVDCEDGPPKVIGSHVLLAMGRQPNTGDLGLDAAGVAMNEHGYITVDDELRTSVPGIWAMGDCNGRGAFTHTSYNDFEIIAENMLDGAHRRVSDRIETYGLFIDPPLGRAGMTEPRPAPPGTPCWWANGR